MAKRPNIIVFMTDDQGYGDLSCMGATPEGTDFRTPHLDALAAGGVRFTDFYANSPVCSPSRAALLSGRYPGNAGVRAILAGHRTATGLPPEVPTLATALKREGYATAMFGKWHLGLADGCRPHDHGFDHWFGFLAGCIDFYSHIFYWCMAGGKHNPTHDLWENDREVYCDGQYMTELITERAVAWLRGAAARQGGDDKPFFMFVPYNAPHYPMHAPQKYKDRFPHLAWDRQIMAAMLSAVDDGVGAIVDELHRQNAFDNTIIFFMSDNGPSRETRNWLDGRTDPYYGGSAGSFKGHKFSLFEGGIRVPGLLHWPAGLQGGRVISEPVAAMDLFPTLLRAAAGDSGDYELDGIDLTPMLAGDRPWPPRCLFWEMNDQTAVRRGPWKLVLNGRLVEQEGPVAAEHLANLDADPGERHNLAAAQPDLTAELRRLALDWRDGIEQRWQRQWQARPQGLTSAPSH